MRPNNPISIYVWGTISSLRWSVHTWAPWWYPASTRPCYNCFCLPNKHSDLKSKRRQTPEVSASSSYITLIFMSVFKRERWSNLTCAEFKPTGRRGCSCCSWCRWLARRHRNCRGQVSAWLTLFHSSEPARKQDIYMNTNSINK